MLPFFFTMKCTVKATMFEDFIRGVMPAAVVKINKMGESRSPHLEVNELGFMLILFNNI